MTFDTCLKKQADVTRLFDTCQNEEDKYKKIIELGKKAPPLAPEYKIEDNIVPGCQSTVYLHAYAEGGKIYFEAESDAMISAGLAKILIDVYSGETPEVILKCAPDYLREIGIDASLTPSRANGLYSIHLQMRRQALKLLMTLQ